MAACGRADGAIEQVLAHPEGGASYAARDVAGLMAGVGRTEEALAVLEQQSPKDNWAQAGYLIDLGRIEDAVAVLQRHEAWPPVPWSGSWHDDPPF